MPLSRATAVRRARALGGRDDLAALLPSARPLSWYRPGRRVCVADRMQTRYAHTLTAAPGEDLEFAPASAPAQILKMGASEGKYLNDCVLEFPREWYAAALPASAPGGPTPRSTHSG